MCGWLAGLRCGLWEPCVYGSSRLTLRPSPPLPPAGYGFTKIRRVEGIMFFHSEGKFLPGGVWGRGL
jgi:hypothetical protein